MAYLQPRGFKRRLFITLPAPNGVVTTLKQFIIDGLNAAKADLFNNDQLQVNAFITAIGSWKVQDGFLEHASPAGATNFYLLTNFLGKDSVTSAIFPYTGANMTTYGVSVGQATSRHYFGDIFAEDVLIYSPDNTISIALDLYLVP